MRAMKTKVFARWADDKGLAKTTKAGELIEIEIEIEIEVDDNG